MKQSAVTRFMLLYANSHRKTKETSKICVVLNVVQCVTLDTEPGISLIFLPLMRILERNLKRIYLIV